MYLRVYAQPKNLPQIAYMQINKGGCCSILSALYSASTHNDITKTLNVHDEFHNRISFNEYEYEELPKNIFTFTFVRNPIYRFIDFYFDKIKNRNKLSGWLNRFGFTGNMSVSKVADILLNVPEQQFDPHFMPQYDLVFQHGILGVDFIGRLENANFYWNVIKNYLHTKVDLPHIHQILTIKDMEEFKNKLDIDTLSKLKKFYEKDLKYFNYEV